MAKRYKSREQIEAQGDGYKQGFKDCIAALSEELHASGGLCWDTKDMNKIIRNLRKRK